MNWLKKAEPCAVHPTPVDDLDAMLLSILEFGTADLFCSARDKTFHCKITMNTTASGAEFNIRSEFNHATPTAAVAEALERARKVLPGGAR